MIKRFLKQFILTKNIYEGLRKAKINRNKKAALNVERIFINRKHDKNQLCIILAGYKAFLYKDIFDRLSAYIPQDIDVCIVSSGIYSEKLASIAEQQSWSYLSTKKNCITLAENVAIYLHEKAEYIYKLDEDIFITKGSFETLLQTYKHAVNSGEYEVGFVAPIIPVNGYGHMRILDKLGLKAVYEEKFERPLYASHSKRMIEYNGNAARFFWGEGGHVPSIDRLNQLFQEESMSYNACPIRFSIGFILFKRKLWEEMGMFQVVKDSPCLGVDEIQICSYCLINSKGMLVSENTVVGHLAFGQQTESMKEYYKCHPETFSLK